MAETWTKYPLRGIDIRLLRKLKKDAKRQKISLAQYMRSILCEHYQLDCPYPGGDSKIEFGSRYQLLKLQPELHQAIKEDAAHSQVTMRSLIIEALEAHYPQEAVVD